MIEKQDSKTLETEDDWYALKIGEKAYLREHADYNESVLRVPGGWIFSDRINGGVCFIPIDLERKLEMLAYSRD